MPESAANPVYANVAFLRIPRFDARPVAEQAALKEKLEARARAALAGVAPDERVVLDSDDGLAVILFGDPARALDTAQALHVARPAGAAGGPQLRAARAHLARRRGARVRRRAHRGGGGGAVRRAGPPARDPGFRQGARGSRPGARCRASRRPATSPIRGCACIRSTRPIPAPAPARARRALVQTLAGVAAILALGAAGRYANQVYFAPQPARGLLRHQAARRGLRRRRGARTHAAAHAPRGARGPARGERAPSGLRAARAHGGPQGRRADDGEPRVRRAARQEPKGGFWRELRRKFWGS